jgi:GATA-binding protein, other eukaryote
MSNARHGEERGGIAALRATDAFASPVVSTDRSQDSFPLSSSFAAPYQGANINLDLDLATPQSNVRDFAQLQPSSSKQSAANLDLQDPAVVAGNELLRDAAFPDWQDDTAANTEESPEELQKKDPLGAQIWKLYSRTKTRLPNQERMENLTWRMMAMNLRRREQQAACVLIQNPLLTCTDKY